MRQVLDRLLDGMIVTLHADHIVATAEAMNGAPLDQKERYHLLSSMLTSRLTDMYPRDRDRHQVFIPNKQPQPVGRGRSVKLDGVNQDTVDPVMRLNVLLKQLRRADDG